MHTEFDMSDLGRLAYYLGIEDEQKDDYIQLKQSSYAKKVLERAVMLDCSPCKYPMESRSQLNKDEHGKTYASGHCFCRGGCEPIHGKTYKYES